MKLILALVVINLSLCVNVRAEIFESQQQDCKAVTSELMDKSRVDCAPETGRLNS